MSTDDKLDSIANKIADIDATLKVQHQILDEHQRRSKANEDAIDIISKRLEPIQAQYIVIKFIAKWVGILIGSEALFLLIQVILNKGKL